MRSFTIHAHFYQPPREDPITGVIPVEPSAYPYPNWNERIYAECYRPNVDLRNFEKISFNVGPTLFAWLRKEHPDTHQKIIEQDQANVRRFGVGNALAQAYNHTILPLGGYQDKVTQVYWGIADFEHRFKRRPDGMWLPETAVDNETLFVLASHNIQFTILAPWQALPADIDITEPYTVTLPDQQQIAVFFYQRELSARVSFDPGATINADHFARELLAHQYMPEKSARNEPQLLMMASDGELYGHHQALRERFLAHLVNGASSSSDLHPTYPALWMRQNPPRRQVKIRENTSWSCHHGIRRWMASCPCTPGDGKWKITLRSSLEKLGVAIDEIYLDITRHLVDRPWALRHRYIHVLLGEMSADQLAHEMAWRALTSAQLRRLLLILEAQRERQRMFTSCGWFFDEFDRIEPKNNLAYAAQAVHLARLASGVNLSEQTIQDLGQVTSSRTGLKAAHVFQEHLQRAEEALRARVGYA